MDKSYNEKVIKNVINYNFTFADLSKRFEGVDSSTGNFYCPFHENHDTPAAKMYWDEDREIWVIYCFGECHRSYTTYDYVKLILCEKYQKYKSPLHFLKTKLPEYKLNNQLNLFQKHLEDDMEAFAESKKIYIDNTFSETGNIVDFIEKLYTA